MGEWLDGPMSGWADGWMGGWLFAVNEWKSVILEFGDPMSLMFEQGG